MNTQSGLSDGEPTLLRTLKGHKQSVIALDLYPSCKYIASAGMDNVIFLWNLTKKTAPVKLTGHKSQIHDLKFSPTGSMIVSASNDESLKFWDIDYEISKKETTLIKAHNARIRGVSFSCDGLLLASCGDDKLVKVWSTVDRRLQYSLKKHNNWVRNCEFSPTASNLASCDDKFVHIWDVSTKKHIQSYSQHSGVIHRAKFHSLGNCMATCSHDTKIKLYDLRSQSVIQVYQGHKGPVKSIDFHPHAPYLISSSDDGTTKIWNTKKSQLQFTIETHSNNTRFSQHGDYFISGGSDKTINVWKTGFYDSLNENIISGSEQTDTGSSKVTSNINLKRMTNLTQNTEESAFYDNTTRNNFELKTNTKLQMETNVLNKNRQKMDVVEQQQPSLYYNHEDNHMELKDKMKLNESKSLKQIKRLNYAETDGSFVNIKQKNQILPSRLVNKLQRISHQLEFITKTTQILEARVSNNGDQLKRLVDLTYSLKNGVDI